MKKKLKIFFSAVAFATFAVVFGVNMSMSSSASSESLITLNSLKLETAQAEYGPLNCRDCGNDWYKPCATNCAWQYCFWGCE